MVKNTYEKDFLQIYHNIEKETQNDIDYQTGHNKKGIIIPVFEVNLIDILLFLISNATGLITAIYFSRNGRKKERNEEQKKIEELQNKTKSLEFQASLKDRKIQILQTSFATLKRLIVDQEIRLSKDEVKNRITQDILDNHGEMDKKTEKLVDKVMDSYREYFELY